MKAKLNRLVPQTIKNFFHLIQGFIAATYFRFPAKRLTVIGVTGTDGKTTTSTILYQILKQAGFKVAVLTTVAAYAGNKEIDTGFHVTSPDRWPLQKLLKEIADEGYTHIVLEATSHGLDQHRLYGIDFTIGVLTNITHEHLDYHKTYERYVKAKSKLFKSAQVAILNKQDSSYTLVKKLLPQQISLLTYDKKTLTGKTRQSVIRAFPQKYNQLNATAAIQAAQYLGVAETKIIQAISNFSGIKGRMELIKNTKKIKAVVDFAHTPNGLENALKSLRSQSSGRLIAVYGSAGLRDYQKRPLMGNIGSQYADEVVLTAEDPRTESVWGIIDQMLAGVKTNIGHVHSIPDRQQAINFAVSLAKPGDTVAVLGKGHEKSMCFGKIEHPWSDQSALTKALK